jgi:peptidoglycan/LPS O-acetylase OafA/YrhL
VQASAIGGSDHEVIWENKIVGPGFDFLRVFLALSIVAFHSWTVTNQYFAPVNLDDTPVWIVHYTLVPMFFALSGFLISASATRLSLKNFLLNRGARIVPALAVDTLVCALIIGPLFTRVSLHHYFFSRQFGIFFFNMVGWVHFTLPGVFTDHAVPEVNGSLWTVPFEIGCYALISALIILKMMKNRIFTLAFVSSYLVLGVMVQAFHIPAHIHSPALGKVISVAFLEHEAQAVTGFLFGIIAYQLREMIPYNRWLFTLSAGIIFGIALAFPSMDQGQVPALRFLLMPAIVYLTIFAGLTPLPLPKFFHTGDYSYGIYLYHQPFLQIIITLFPAAALAPHIGPWFTLFAGLPLVFFSATMSWHLVEKPCLALRKRFYIMAKTRAIEPETAPEWQAAPPQLATDIAVAEKSA